MRALPYFLGACTLVAIGGALAGAAIDTTPRMIHDSPSVPTSTIEFEGTDERPQGASNHYPLETRDGVIEVAELRDRGLYSQDRYGYRSMADEYADEYGGEPESFDFAAADAEAERWNREQHVRERRRVAYADGTYRGSPSSRRGNRGAMDREPGFESSADAAQPQVQFVSTPVVQKVGNGE